MKNLDTFMLNVGLTKPQLEGKKHYIGGSSAKDIADGNWLKVYNRMLGIESEDLSRVFKVQLGHITEEFNLTWFADKHEWILPDQQEEIAITNKDHPFIGCLPDAIMKKNGGHEAVIDAKHSMCKAPWWDEQKVAETYFPQAQHNMIACGLKDFWLTVIFGNDEPTPIQIEYNEEWCEQYIRLCKAFWTHIERKDPPEATGMDAIAQPVISLDDMREVDMTKGNMAGEWEQEAETFITTKPQHAKHEKSKKAIKEMIAEDVREATGNGIVAKRDKRGVSIKEQKQ